MALAPWAPVEMVMGLRGRLKGLVGAVDVTDVGEVALRGLV